jgi:hypothetical protein
MSYALASLPALMGAIDAEQSRKRRAQDERDLLRTILDEGEAVLAQLRPQSPAAVARLARSNCPNCGAPHEAVCSYCGTKESA